MKIARHIPILSLFATILMTAPGQKSSTSVPAKRATVTGTYSVSWKKQAGCVLQVLQLSDDKIKFDLVCNRGAPSYNMGGSSGEIPLKDSVATYTDTEPGPCEISFKFMSTKVVVSQSDDKRECGWGYGVVPNGTYLLKSRKPPKFEQIEQ